MKRVSMCLLLAGLLTGCGAGSGEGLDEQGLPSEDNGNGGNDTPPAPGTLAQLQADIFSPICAQCHTGGGAPEGLRLDSEQSSYDSLVNQPSGQQPSVLRVAPGDPEGSYLLRKLEGADGIDGGQMPLGMSPLSATRIAQVRDWIENGAPREGVGDAPTSVSLQGHQSEQRVVTLRFSRSVSIDSLSDAVQVYFHSDGQRVLASPEQYALSLQDGQQLRIHWYLPDYPVTAAEFVVNDPAVATLLDQQHRALDGDRDRTEGGLFRHEISF